MASAQGITIGIPAYNARKTLERALDSALSQTVRVPFEVIVVDDGSTDTTANIGLSYELMFPDVVRLIRTKNRGVAAARNTIVQNARYDHLTWLDADDYYYPTKLERQYDALLLHAMIHHQDLANPNVIVFSRFRLGREVYDFNRYLRAPIPAILTGAFRAYLWASMTATAAYQDTGPFNEALHRSEDTDWLLRFLSKGDKTIIATPGAPVMDYHFSTQRDGAAVEHSFHYMVSAYGDDMKSHGVYAEYIPRRWWEIANFYHSNKKWDDMWRCRAMAAYMDPARYGERLAMEIKSLASEAERKRISNSCEKYARAAGIL